MDGTVKTFEGYFVARHLFDTFYFIVGFWGQEKAIDIGCLVYEEPNNLGPAFDSSKQR